MGTPKIETKILGIHDKLRLLKRGAKLGKQMKVEDFEKIMEMVKEIVLPFVKQLDKPIFTNHSNKENVPKDYQGKRGILMFESKITKIWLQRSGEWFTKYLYQESSNFSFENGLTSHIISEDIIHESDRFIDDFVEIAKDCLEALPFLKQIFLYYILPLKFVTGSLDTIKKAVEERRKQLLEMEDSLGFLDDFTKSLDPLTCREKKLSLEEYSIFSDTKHGESRDTEGYFTLDDLNPFWEIVKMRSHREKYHLNAFNRKFDSLDHLIMHLMYTHREIAETPPTRSSAKELFGRTSGRFPFSEAELIVIKKFIESI